MDITSVPEVDSTALHCGDLSLHSNLDPLIQYLRELSEPEPFDEYVRRVLGKNRMSFQLPSDDQALKIAAVVDGFAVGLQSGRVIHVLPPASTIINLASTPITALDGIGSKSLLVATGSDIICWGFVAEQVEHTVNCGAAVTAVMCNVKKDVIAAGCSNGEIVLCKVENYTPCLFNVVARLSQPSSSDTSEVVDIKTNDTTTWLAAIFLSKCIAIWEHESVVLLYCFSFQNTTVLPSIYPQGQRITLPEMIFCEKSLEDKWFKAWNKHWTVTPDFILLHSGTIIRLSGTAVSKIYRITYRYAKDDEKWSAYAAVSKKGSFVFDAGSHLVAITQAGVSKTPVVVQKCPVIEVDLGVKFTDCCESRFGSYLALLSDQNTLEVITVVATASQMIHSLTGSMRYKNSCGAVYWRFQRLVTERGDYLIEKRDDKLWGPIISKNAFFALFRHRDNKNASNLIRTSDGHTINPTTNSPIIMHAFSKRTSLFLLIDKGAAYIWDLSTMTLKLTVPGKFSEKTRPRFISDDTLFIFNQSEVVIVLSKGNIIRQTWNWDKVTRLPDDNFLVYTISKTCYYTWNGTELVMTKETKPGYDLLRVFNSGRMCAGLNASGVRVLSLPAFTPLIQLPSSVMLLVDRDSDFFATYTFASTGPGFDELKVWDLKTGISVWKVEMGLKSYLNNAPEIPAANLFPQWMKLRVDYQKPANLRLFKTWAFDISFLGSSGLLPLPETANTIVYEEKLPQHCVIMKLFSDLALTGRYDSTLSSKLLIPWKINVLHILVYRNQPVVLTQALHDGAAVVQSIYGTPISLCIERNTRKCLDSILQALIALGDSASSDLLTALYHMRYDIPSLIRFGSVTLPDFLRILMRPKPEEIISVSTLSGSISLPTSTVSDGLWIAKFRNLPLSLSSFHHEAVEFLVCSIPIHAELGSSASLDFLSVLVCNVTVLEVLNNEFIRTLVDMKWNKLWPMVLGITVCYWVYLILMLLRVFEYSDSGVNEAFLVFNSLFLVLDVVQLMTSIQHIKENLPVYLGICRCGLAYAWVAASPRTWLTFLTVLACLIRGLTTFQTFAPTRFFVRMIYTVCLKTISFIFILIYSTLSFGLLFAVADPAAISTFTQSWSVSAQLDMGGFDMTEAGGLVWAVFLAASLVNVVWLLNLLISILGQAYADFQPEAEGADIMAKAGFVYHFEGMMLWRRRFQRTPQFLQICTREASTQRHVSVENRLSQLSAQINELENRLMSKDSFEQFKVNMESRLMELKTLLKQS